MRVRLIVVVVALMSFAPVARAEWSLGRFFGYGWSDGYHSHSACPPRRNVVHGPAPVAPKPTALPWWATPAAPAEAEAIPHPAAAPSPNATYPPSGQSLFRQPGEGASVVTSNRSASPPN